MLELSSLAIALFLTWSLAGDWLEHHGLMNASAREEHWDSVICEEMANCQDIRTEIPLMS